MKFCQKCGKELMLVDGGHCPFCGCIQGIGYYILQEYSNLSGWNWTYYQPTWMTGLDFFEECFKKVLKAGNPWRIIDADLNITHKGEGK
jgi:hypothetical protein